MPMLHELQLEFMRGVLDGASGTAAQWVSGGGLEPARRIEVYANNARSNFIEALQLCYPVIRRLVGDEYFHQCAREFQRRRPSRSGDLQNAGAGFPEYLAELHRDDAYRYFADVARLEWLAQEALTGADHAPMDLAKLAAVAPGRYEELRFRLHPAARLFDSKFPALDIVEANLDETAQEPRIDLAQGSQRVLLARAHGRLEYYRLGVGEYELLRALQAREPFGEAVEAALGAEAGFDPAAALQRFVSAEAIVDF
jgi:hypothetical protein